MIFRQLFGRGMKIGADRFQMMEFRILVGISQVFRVGLKSIIWWTWRRFWIIRSDRRGMWLCHRKKTWVMIPGQSRLTIESLDHFKEDFITQLFSHCRDNFVILERDDSRIRRATLLGLNRSLVERFSKTKHLVDRNHTKYGYMPSWSDSIDIRMISRKTEEK